VAVIILFDYLHKIRLFYKINSLDKKMKVIEIQKRIKNAKDLDFGMQFSLSIALFKKVWVQGLVVLLLNMIMVIPVLMVVYMSLILTGFFETYSSNFNPNDPSLEAELSSMMMVSKAALYSVLIVAMSTISFGL
jgi:hypothetical protein